MTLNIKDSFYRTVHGPHHPWWALGVTSIGTFMTTADSGIVAISLPRIMASFETSLALISWVVLSYLLTTTALLLPAGRLGDIIGRKKVFNLGFLIYTCGSVLCGLSQSTMQLIAFRSLQAIGASMLMTNSFAIVSAVFSDRERGKALGVTNTFAAVGITAGPVIGGLAVNLVGWRGIFFITIPLGLAGTILAHLVLEEKRVSISPEKVNRRFDIPGACVATVAVGALLVGLSLGQERSWSAMETRLMLGAALMAMVAFPWLESRSPNPMVDLRLFKNRIFTYGNLARLASFLSSSVNTLLMPFFLQIVLGYSPLQAGLIIAPYSLMVAITAPIFGSLTNRISARVLASGGMLISTVALYLLGQLGVSSSYPDILFLLLLHGLGLGMFTTPNNTAIIGSVSREGFGIASGILSLSRQMGHSLGTAMATTIVVTSMHSVVGKVSLYDLRRDAALLGQGQALQAFAGGIRAAFLVAAAICVIGAMLSMARGKSEGGKARS